MAKTALPMQGAWFDPWSGTRSHMTHLRAHTLQLKIQNAVTKTQ